jgi:prevent-host-death family protein
MPVVRVADLVKDGAKRRRLRRSSILDKIGNTNRVLSTRSRPLSGPTRHGPSAIQASRGRRSRFLRCFEFDRRDFGDREQIEGCDMARSIRNPGVREIPLSEVKDDLSHLLREAAKGDTVITRHGKPAGVLIGFESEDDWFEYRLENDPRFPRRIEKARKSLRSGRGVRLEDL